MRKQQQNFRSIAFVDSNLEAQEQLISGIVEGVEVVKLESKRDGVTQITEFLAQYQGKVNTVHIVSHGKPGCLYLGNAQLNLDNFNKYAEQLQQWFAAVGNVSPNLLIYGCQVAAGDAGEEFLAKLHQFTQANIAASANLTGNAALEGDWELEVTLGEGKFTSAFTQETMADYAFVFEDGTTINDDNGLKQYLLDKGLSTESQTVVSNIFNTFEVNEVNPSNTPTARFNIRNGKLQVTYLGTGLSLDALVPDVNGFELKDFTRAVNLDLPSIPISGTPSLTIKNYQSANQAEYELLVEDFSLSNFINSVTTAAGLTFNSNLKTSLEKISKFDFYLSGDKVELKSSGNSKINLSELVTSDSVKAVVGEAFQLEDFVLTYSVDENNQTDFSMSSNIYQGENIFDVDIEFNGDDYQISVEDFPVGDFISSMATAAGVIIKSGFETSLKNLGEFDLFVSEDKVELKSSSDSKINLSELVTSDSVKAVVGEAFQLEDFVLTYSVDENNQSDFSVSSNIYQGENIFDVDIKFKGDDYTISLTDFPVGDFLDNVAIEAGINLSSAFETSLKNLGEFDLFVSEDKVELKSSSDSKMNLSELITNGSVQKVVGEQLQLEDFVLTYSVDENNQTDFSVSSNIYQGENIFDVDIEFNGDDYQISVEDFPVGDFIDNVATEAGINLSSAFETSLRNLGEFDLFVSEDKVELKSSSDSKMNLSELIEDASMKKVVGEAFQLEDFVLTYSVDENNQSDFSVSSNIYQGENIFDVDIKFKGDDYTISLTDFPVGDFLDNVATEAGINLSSAFETSLKNLGEFDLFVSEDKIELKSSSDSKMNLSELITNGSVQKVVGDQLQLEDFVLTYSVDKDKKTDFSVSSKIIEGTDTSDVDIDFNSDDYTISVKELPVGEFIDNIAKEAGVTLQSDLEKSLEDIGKFDLFVSKEKVSLKSSGNITVDLSNVATVKTPLESLDKAINDTIADIFGSNQLTILQPELSYVAKDDEKDLTLSAKIGEGENLNDVSFDFDNKDVKLEYQIGKDFALSSLTGIKDLESFKFTNLEFIAANYDDTSQNKEFIEGFNFAGEFDFKDGKDTVSTFFREHLEIEELEAKLQVGDQLNLEAEAETKWELIKSGEFTATLSQIDLDLDIKESDIKFDIRSELKLDGYDPSQDNEPELLLDGDIDFDLDNESLNVSFSMDKSSNQVWKNPFGLTGSEFRDFGIEAGVSEVGLNNFGIRGGLKFGEFDIDAALSINITQPEDVALSFTLDEPVSLVELITGPVNPFIFAEGGSNNVLTRTFDFLDRVIDVEAESLNDEDDRDNDGDTEEKLPLIEFVPFAGVEIAGETLEEGFAVNAGVKAWNAEAKLQLNADKDFNEFEGSLSLDNIDLGFLKIAGADEGNNELDLDIVIDTQESSSSYIKGDGQLEIFGITVAKADFKVSEDSLNINDLDLNLFDVVALDIENLDIEVDWKNIDDSSASGTVDVKVLQHDIADATFSVNQDNFSVSGKLDFRILGYDVGVDVDVTFNDDKKEIALMANAAGENFNETFNLSELSSNISSIEDWAENWLKKNVVDKVEDDVKDVGNTVADGAKDAWHWVTHWGPLAGATVFVDTNSNLQADSGELQTTTDNNGQFSFEKSKIAALDINGDNNVDLNEAQIVAISGIDTTTGLAATIPIVSEIGSISEPSNTATPLTTLKAVFSSQGIATTNVETLLNKISGLSLDSVSQHLEKFDPYIAIGQNDSTGVNIASGHIKVTNLLLNGTTFLEASEYQGSDAQIQVITALGKVLQNFDSFDLSKDNDLQKLFTQLTDQLNLSINDEIITTVSELIAETNQLVDDFVEQALSRSVSHVLPSISPIKKAVYSTLPTITQQLVKGEITAEQSQSQLQELLNTNTFLVQHALNENRTVRVTASPTVTEGNNAKGQFTITLGEPAPSQGLKILYNISGSATLGQDYNFNQGQLMEIDVEPGATEAIVNLEVLEDTLVEDSESIGIHLRHVGNGYVIDPANKTALIEITDNDEGNSANSQAGMRQKGTFRNDILEGKEYNDTLMGKAGEDILIGGAGLNLLQGGGGADVFYFKSPSEGNDLILDFNPSEGDKIQISANGFNTNSLTDFSFLAGTLKFKQQTIALIQNNGQTYNHFANLADIIEIVSEPTVQAAPNPATETLNQEQTKGIFTVENLSVDLLFSLNNNNQFKEVVEIGVFTVNDKQGTINGISPGTSGYQQAALENAKVIFSLLPNSNLPNGLTSTDIQRALPLDKSSSFAFYQIKGKTTQAALKENGNTDYEIVFSNASEFQTEVQTDGSFAFNWSDESNQISFNVQTQEQQAMEMGTKLQNESGLEVIDLSNESGSIALEVTVHREAAVDDLVIMYKMEADGSVLDPLTGDKIAATQENQSRYLRAALANRVNGLNISTDNQTQTTLSSELQGGAIYAPMMIFDPNSEVKDNLANPDAWSEEVQVYFLGTELNSDGEDHVRLLGNNHFGFEDLYGGGDKDFNDLIVKFELSSAG